MYKKFWDNVNKDGDCWEWVGSINGKGYGQLCLNGEYKLAHRLSWEIHYGQIPKGMQVLHRCDNRCCTNPQHLFVGTHQDNMDDKVSKGRASHTRGTDNGQSIITERDVLTIIKLRNSGLKYREIADLFNVDKSHIGKICRGKRWEHLLLMG